MWSVPAFIIFFVLYIIMQRVGNVVVAMQKMKNLVLRDQDPHKAQENEGDKTAQGATGGPP